MDAGKKGGYAVFDEKGRLSEYGKIPLNNKGEIDFKAMVNIVCGRRESTFIIEEQFVKEGQGHSKSIFTNLGVLMGIGYALCDDVHLVNARKWKTALNLVSKGAIKKTKQHAVTLCNKKYGTDFTLKEDGIAEAILIGHYFKLLKGNN
jgi:hypothetical protein